MPGIISIIGTSDSGKTTLLERLIPEIIRRGYRVGVIKHSVHGFNLDKEGKDSWRHKKAGAHTIALSSSTHVAMIRDVAQELTIDHIVSSYMGDMDIILTEGYKKEKKPKIEILRKDDLRKDLLCKDDKNLIAVVTDKKMEIDVPCFGSQDIVQLVDFLEEKHFIVKAGQEENKVQKEDNPC
jgi:molybdopterin-guanine dinucleotide biosynthesis protein B